jgi:hypothetical protein
MRVLAILGTLVLAVSTPAEAKFSAVFGPLKDVVVLHSSGNGPQNTGACGESGSKVGPFALADLPRAE